MPNPTASAAGGAMPALNRRAILGSLAAAPLAIPPVVSLAVQPVASEPSALALPTYREWLALELRQIEREMFDGDVRRQSF
jgi:hypothetical protein